MISSTLSAFGCDLQRAATRRAYGDVERLAARVGQAALDETRALPAGDPGIHEIAAWLKDLFERTEILLRIARVSQADELRQLKQPASWNEALVIKLAPDRAIPDKK